ncbi:hypothetical protein FQA39_LY10200 [Lamprigera yunnana]|nr:hypothetical protein FQA39_LY10200 [Lamprigera yunnana]
MADRREAIEATTNTSQTETADAKCKLQSKPEAVMQESKEEENAHAETKEHATDTKAGESVIDSRAAEPIETKTSEETANSKAGNSKASQETHAVVEEASKMVDETHNADAEALQPEGKAKVEVHDSKIKEQSNNSKAAEQTLKLVARDESKAATVGKADDTGSTDATRELDIVMVATFELESADTPSIPQTEQNVDFSPTDATFQL